MQNLPDGRVKVVAEGDDTILERFLNDLRIKDPLIDVQGIESNYTSATGDFMRFEKMVANGETDQRLDKAAELLGDLIVVNKQIVAQLMVNNEEIKGVREEVKGSREDIRAVHEEVKGVREEVKGSREDLNKVRESIQDASQEITSSGEMIAEKIDDAREEITGEVKEFHSDLKDNLKERLVRMEADVSQIKARIVCKNSTNLPSQFPLFCAVLYLVKHPAYIIYKQIRCLCSLPSAPIRNVDLKQ